MRPFTLSGAILFVISTPSAALDPVAPVGIDARPESAEWSVDVAGAPPVIELDLDGDTRQDSAEIAVGGDGRVGVRVCLSTREACDIVADGAGVADRYALRRREPGCHDYLHEGAQPVQPRPGNVCSTADALELAGDPAGASLLTFDNAQGRYVRYWLKP